MTTATSYRPPVKYLNYELLPAGQNVFPAYASGTIEGAANGYFKYNHLMVLGTGAESIKSFSDALERAAVDYGLEFHQIAWGAFLPNSNLPIQDGPFANGAPNARASSAADVNQLYSRNRDWLDATRSLSSIESAPEVTMPLPHHSTAQHAASDAVARLKTAKREVVVFGLAVVGVTGGTALIAVDFAPLALISSLALGAVALSMIHKRVDDEGPAAKH